MILEGNFRNTRTAHRKGNIMKRSLLVLASLLLAILVVSTLGCETWKGAGKDVEHTGDSMQGK